MTPIILFIAFCDVDLLLSVAIVTKCAANQIYVTPPHQL